MADLVETPEDRLCGDHGLNVPIFQIPMNVNDSHAATELSVSTQLDLTIVYVLLVSEGLNAE